MNEEDVSKRREEDLFHTYQKVLEKGGRPNRNEAFWLREENELFSNQLQAAGIDFYKYTQVPAQLEGDTEDDLPIFDFDQALQRYQLPDVLMENMKRLEWRLPTPVQKYAIPAGINGRDVMVSAQTGSGKTGAFVVPIVTRAMREGPKPFEMGPVKPSCVVLLPTRELCIQVAEEARRLCLRSPIRVCTIYGGKVVGPMLKALADGCDIAVCTPGRLQDFLVRKIICVTEVKYLVMDEADKMLEMGFEPEIRNIVEYFKMSPPGKRQTMMFSATMPRHMQELALDFMVPEYLSIQVGRVGKAEANIQQRFSDVSRLNKQDKFLRLMETIGLVKSRDGKVSRTIVFANTKDEVEELGLKLQDKRIKVAWVHGDLEQSERQAAITAIKTGEALVLVATDLASRGIDIPNIGHVVNFTLPKRDPKDYVHRIGRTGRIGNKGYSTSFVTNDEPCLREIVKEMLEVRRVDREAPLPPEWLLLKADMGNVAQKIYQKDGQLTNGATSGNFRTFDPNPLPLLKKMARESPAQMFFARTGRYDKQDTINRNLDVPTVY